MKHGSKKRAPKLEYVSQNQLSLEGFETPFSQKLNKDNRWVILAGKIPWDEICNVYTRQAGISHTGRPPISPRIVIGSLIIKHMCNLDDRETVAQISENMYMQYFLGYTSFSPDPPFDASLFVEFRNRMGLEQINALNEKIHHLYQQKSARENEDVSDPPPSGPKQQKEAGQEDVGVKEADSSEIPAENKGRVLFDATACPQNIAYPTDLGLLNEAREKTEELIDTLSKAGLQPKKPRTYRKIARKEFLKVAQKRKKSKKEIRRAIRMQLGYVARNLKSINLLLDLYTDFPLKAREQKYLMVIHTLYQQQKKMFDEKVHSVEDRIVSIHQPHVRPIVRGKTTAKVEFGSKIHISLVDGYTFLDQLSWDAFNEGKQLEGYVEQYRKRFGYYPAEVLADQIYCSRDNRKLLKGMGIKLLAKPLGRPAAVKKEHVRPGERNPVEGKFGQAKTAYGLNNIKARLKETSQSWIACIIMVLNLVKLAGAASLCLFDLKPLLAFFSKRGNVKEIKLWVDDRICPLPKYQFLRSA